MSVGAELDTKQVMIVGGKAHAQVTLRNALAVAGIKHVAAVSDSRRAIDLLRLESFAALYVDEKASPFDGMPFYRAARRTRGVLDPMIPIFLVCSSPRKKFVEALRDQGVTDVITRPTAPGTLLRKLRIALELPRAFIQVGDFFGPDRRGGQRPPYVGPDRRETRLLPVEEEIDLDDDDPNRVLI